MHPINTCVLTGAAHGIGKDLALGLLRKGVTVYGVDTDASALEALQSEAKKYSYTFHSMKADVSDLAAMREVRDSVIQKSSGIDLWINNAGVSGKGDFLETPIEKTLHVLRVNLDGVIIGTRLALETMEEKGRGTILNIASVAGHMACPYLTSYCASKHGVVGFTRSLREELNLKKSQVRLMSASPGFVDTRIIEKGSLRGFPEWLSWILSDATTVAKEILAGIGKKDLDIYPTLNGKLMLGLHRVFPRTTEKGSRVLLAKSVKDLLLFRKTPPT